MASVRIKGIKRYRRRGKWYYYHRATGTRIRAEFGTAEFFVELAKLEERRKKKAALPGTLGLLLKSYQASPAFTDLARSTKAGYRKIIQILAPLDEMPLSEMTAQFVAGLRDKIAGQRGRRTANFVLAVLSVAAEHGREHGVIKENPVKGIKRVKRPRHAEQANRPWSRAECRTVIDRLPLHLAVPVALAMFTGLRQGDVLSLTKAAIKDGSIWRRTGKTGQLVHLPIHPDLAKILAAAPSNDAITVAANSNGKPWTADGFRTSFGKEMRRLRDSGAIEPGLTFHGLRHTVGTLLREVTDDLDLIRRWLGQKTLAMAIHYSDTADTSEQMRKLVERLDPLGRKARTKVSNAPRKVSNAKRRNELSN